MAKKKSSPSTRKKADTGRPIAGEAVPLPDKVQFHMIKSPQFRVVHVDGVWGGPSANGLIHMAVFNERAAIPEYLVHSVKDGALGPEIDRSGKAGYEREIEADLIMDLRTAMSIRDWLVDKIDLVQKRQGRE